MTPKIVVFGAGPAGLAAATEAARAGAAVTVCEERSEPGGQLRYRVQPVVAQEGLAAERPGHIAERLIAEAHAAGVEIRTGTVVAACFAPNELLVVRDGDAQRWTPDALIVATGSTDLPYPFAGATFPGVFSARGLRILLHQHRVRPGRRFAIIGSGEDAEELAVDVMLADGEVVWSGIAPAPFLRAAGADGVREIWVGQERYPVDCIVIAVGRQADPALATMAGVPLGFAAELGGLVPVVDERMQSPIPGLFVAGDAAGVGSVAAVIAEGRLAGVAAAASLGLAGDENVAATRAAGGAELEWRQTVRASLQSVVVQPFAFGKR
jgi:thioredoxin reductase